MTIFFADQGTTAVPETSTGIFAYHAHNFILISTEVLLHGNPYVEFKVQSCNSFRTLGLIHYVHTKLFILGVVELLNIHSQVDWNFPSLQKTPN